MERAADANVPLWCDDAATRTLAAAFGVASFGTPELVEYLRSIGQIADAMANAIDAALIRGYAVGVQYRPEVWDLSWSFEGDAPGGVAQAILLCGPQFATEKMQLVARAMQRAVDQPQSLRDWSSVGARYVSEIAGEDEAAIDNLGVFLRTVLNASWIAPHQLDFVADGIRSVAGDRWYPALRKAIRHHWRELRSTAPVDIVAAHILGRISGLRAEDRQLALEIVLRDGETEI
ncbi:hypothetical protein [uncultured Microbacterium sp.]|uniref:Uncharacterized protein n=1 Tax=uncultured Microbacterium sp. TaxID=191216 RepID=A0A1Y5PAQ0_9MICO|nr:hypothetical protein [uncultured Microbacterium sp.]SBS72988.1 hypothetical protein MIPYR_30338 [uncultured Microbacterium sp.]